MQKFMLLAAALALSAGCVSTRQAASPDAGPLVSRLSQEEVRTIAATCARNNGFAVDRTAPWRLSLSAGDEPRVWTAMLILPGGTPPHYWIHVDDRTGTASFVTPAIAVVAPPAGNEWLARVKDGIRRATSPMRIEEFLGLVSLGGIEATGGGTTTDGRDYLEYPLRTEAGSPARFELRCYITTPEGWNGPKIVTSAELSYTDAALNRYRLLDGNQ